MKFGVGIMPDDLVELPRLAKSAEELGFDYVGIPDSQSLFHELYVSLAIAARATTRVQIGPAVANPLTRHPAVTASAIASIDEMSGGRAFLGIGTGDSAVLNLDLRPARLSQLRDYVEEVRAVLSGQTHDYQGRQIHVRRSQTAVPIMVAAEGPKTLALAGAIADIVLVHTGLTPEVLSDSVTHIREGERSAGKREGSTAVWVFAKCNIADVRQDAIDEIKMALAASAHHSFRFTLEGKRVPDELRGPIAVLQREYVPSQHEQLGQTRNATLSDELGLTDYLAERFAIIGTPEECREKTRSIRQAGVDGILITAIGPRPKEIIRLFGQEVIPNVD